MSVLIFKDKLSEILIFAEAVRRAKQNGAKEDAIISLQKHCMYLIRNLLEDITTYKRQHDIIDIEVQKYKRTVLDICCSL